MPLRDAHILEAPEFQHLAQGVDGNGDFGISQGLRARSKRVIDHPRVVTDVGLHQRAIVVAGYLLPNQPMLSDDEGPD